MPDIIDDIFGGEYYPGSKKKRRPFVEDTSTRVGSESWDSHPYKKLIRGKEVEVFTLGALAEALNRPLVTIRLWMRKGYLPQAPFRLPPKIVNGREQKGRRLLTRPMIEFVVDAFQRHGVYDKMRIEWSEHEDLSIEIFEAWRELHENL